jgi:CRISPR/Cas system-associated exonuclease Cas4 (RecB family)
LPENNVNESLQLILYGWAFRMIYGFAPRKLILVNLIKTKKPKIQVLDTSLDEQKERKLMHLMFSVNEAIEKEDFYPNPRSSFGCGSCCYSLSCEYAF